jgi:AraC-like DNA-binding protein
MRSGCQAFCTLERAGHSRRTCDSGAARLREHRVSDARRELAKQYLLQPSLQLGEAACLLGYEDPNSFFRAFREWERTTPGKWRDLLRKRDSKLRR